MTKSELIKTIAEGIKEYDAENKESGGFNKLSTKTKAEMSVDLVLDTIVKGLQDDGKVSISGFGTFEVRERAEKECVNPRTGERMTVPGYKAAVFKSGRKLKDCVNE